MKVIILAGGKGSRLWPFSKEEFPKQFLSFEGKGSLLQNTIDRFSKFVSLDDVVVSTSSSYKKIIEKQLVKKPNILVEPCRKNTAPAIALALSYLEDKCKIGRDEPIVVMPSDHFIYPEEKFLSYLHASIEVAIAKKCFITFGIKPTRAETGYGYIKVGVKVDKKHFEAKTFIEKPPLIDAKRYLNEEGYVWNSGMFLFTPQIFWDELRIHSSEIFQLAKDGFEQLKIVFNQMPNISIDFALMEKTKNMLVCPMNVHWTDIGSWDSVYEMMPKDVNNNVKIGKVVDINTKNSLIVGGKKLISTINLKDIIFVETEEAIFLAKRGKSQDVKKLVKKLREISLKNYEEKR